MAAAEPRTSRLPSPRPRPVSAIWRWLKPARWVLLFICASLAVSSTVTRHAPVGGYSAPGNSASAWTTSAAMHLSREGDGLRFTAGAPGIQSASLPLQPPLTAQFMSMRACLAAPAPVLVENGDETHAAVELLLVSERNGRLDFNRHYATRDLVRGGVGDCYEELFPRFPGDGAAIVQLQLRGGSGAFVLSSLTLRAERETQAWRFTRWVMFGAGMFVIVLLFRGYPRRDRVLLSVVALGSVAAILFGCCVPVALKAQIFVLLTGGSWGPAFGDISDMLSYRFPLGGFSLFTYLHLLFFAAATLSLGLLRSRAVPDLALLAFTTETLQIFVPGRGPGLSDALVDLSGIALALPVLILLRRLRSPSA